MSERSRRLSKMHAKSKCHGPGRRAPHVLCVYANGDGIVPPAVALSVTRRIGSRKVETLEVGDDRMPYAHADMLIGTHARQTVFKPLSSWLERHNPGA